MELRKSAADEGGSERGSLDVERLEIAAEQKRLVVLDLLKLDPGLRRAWTEMLAADDAVFEARRAARERGQ